MKKNTWRYHYFTPVHEKSSWYDLQFLKQCNRVKQVILGHFCPLIPTPLKSQKIKLLKWNKFLEISFYKFVPKISIIWFMVSTDWDWQNFLSFWAIFCPFTLSPLITPNINILKKWKIYLKMLSFYICVP